MYFYLKGIFKNQLQNLQNYYQKLPLPIKHNELEDKEISYKYPNLHYIHSLKSLKFTIINLVFQIKCKPLNHLKFNQIKFYYVSKLIIR